MEQKKILWIVVAVCVFVLIVFGAALILYSPSRSTSASLQQAQAITPASVNGVSKDAVKSQSQIDPDSWVREPGNTPGMDKSLQPSQGGINLTIVNGDNTAANYGSLDVSGLTGTPATPPATGTPALPLSEIPGQSAPLLSQTSADASATAVTSTTVKTAAKPAEKVPAQTATASASAATKTVKPAAKPEARPAPLKTVIEYWIQTGSFSSKINAEKARETLTARYLAAEIFTKESATGATTYRVRIGPYKSKTEADYWLGTVKEIKDFAASFVSEVKTKR